MVIAAPALPAPPAWLLDALSDATADQPTKHGKKAFSLPAEITEGSRNDRLTSTAGKLRRMGLRPDEILAALREINLERC